MSTPFLSTFLRKPYSKGPLEKIFKDFHKSPREKLLNLRIPTIFPKNFGKNVNWVLSIFSKKSYNKGPPEKIFKDFHRSPKGKPLNLRISIIFA